MPEPPRLSPLAGVLVAGEHGLIGPDGPGVVVAERTGLSMVQIAARPGQAEAAVARLAENLDIRLPAEPNTVVAGERASALWIGPGQWLLVAGRVPEGELYRRARESAREVAAVMDQSHGRCVLRISGPKTRALLAKGCPLDLHPRAFRAGACAQTMIGQIAALLHLVDDVPSFDLYLPRGYARAFWEWLADSSAELGYRVL